MKTIKKLLLLVSITTLIPLFISAQGSISGLVADSLIHRPVEDAIVQIQGKGGSFVYTTDAGGHFYSGKLPAGNYEITISYMSNTVHISNYLLAGDEQRELNISLVTGFEVPPVDIVIERHPLIDPLNPIENFSDRKDLANAPILNIKDYLSLQSGITEIDGEVYVRGGRAGSVKYVIDGSILMNPTAIPLCSLDNVRTYIGFVPARFGDTTGGVIAYETRSYFSR